MSPPAGPRLRYFLDRSLGAVVVPTALREAGFDVETMRERYGERRAQRILDVDWLADVGPTGMVVLMKDKRIRTRPAEQQAVLRHAVRCFCVASGNMTGEAMGQRSLRCGPASNAPARRRDRSSTRSMRGG